MFGMFGMGRGPKVQRIAPADAVRMAAAGEVTLLDVREAAELSASGKAMGALHVPLMGVANKCDPNNPACLKGLSVDKPVVVYCAAGGRAERAGAELLSMGYQTAYNLGGLSDWVSGGGKVER